MKRVDMRPFALGLRSAILRTPHTRRLLVLQRRALQLGQSDSGGARDAEVQEEFSSPGSLLLHTLKSLKPSGGEDEGQEEIPTVNFRLRTLSPERLTRNDYVDLSDSRVLVSGRPKASDVDDSDSPQSPPYIHYGRRYHLAQPLNEYTPFPMNARGFFYYHPHDFFPFGGSVRFRVTQDPNPRRFYQGQDLMTEYGTIWQIPLLAIGHLPRLALFKSVLEQDELVTSDFWEKHKQLVDRAHELRLVAHSQVIHRCGEPFYVNMATPNHTIHIATSQEILPLTSRRLFLTSMKLIFRGRWYESSWARKNWPFEKGILICRLERVNGTRSITARVLRILEPVRMFSGLTNDVDTVDLPLVTRGRIMVDKRWSHSLLAHRSRAEKQVMNQLIRISTEMYKSSTRKKFEKLKKKWRT
ncbi:hypothetical protein FKP32DRAFT_1674032 [Trametes sanguinea]|nr:hypothetical protein FKP32DRAFT_1674032 [Trametes sanguinea]